MGKLLTERLAQILAAHARQKVAAAVEDPRCSSGGGRSGRASRSSGRGGRGCCRAALTACESAVKAGVAVPFFYRLQSTLPTLCIRGALLLAANPPKR